MTAGLEGLPRLPDEALGPCAFCGKLMLEAGSPVFYRVSIRQCGIDAKAVRERVGLAMMMGGGAPGFALSAALGPHEKPVVVLSEDQLNVCLNCAITSQSVVLAALASPEPTSPAEKEPA
jgi:hypothetical protein